MSSRKNCHAINSISDLYEIYPYLLFSEDFGDASDDWKGLFLSLLIRVAAASDHALHYADTRENLLDCPRDPELKRKFDLCHEALNELYSSITPI